ncbi:hypothetical protein PR048_019734 [Dryococelus australis]|uniref:Uncharacterized protein n=1 Tax=Dryococelus australis TaxID=614101 RepID=A0ABQ9H4M3_9NEOP|nr:hypothetical protein PR048_019734 [Dryococelus australis]
MQHHDRQPPCFPTGRRACGKDSSYRPFSHADEYFDHRRKHDRSIGTGVRQLAVVQVTASGLSRSMAALQKHLYKEESFSRDEALQQCPHKGMQGDTLKNHVKNSEDSFFEGQQVLLSIPLAASVVTDSSGDHDETVNVDDGTRDLRGDSPSFLQEMAIGKSPEMMLQVTWTLMPCCISLGNWNGAIVGACAKLNRRTLQRCSGARGVEKTDIICGSCTPFSLHLFEIVLFPRSPYPYPAHAQCCDWLLVRASKRFIVFRSSPLVRQVAFFSLIQHVLMTSRCMRDWAVCPCWLAAKQRYSPLSAAPSTWRTSSVPLGNVLWRRCDGKESPPRCHVTLEMGKPATGQRRFNSCSVVSFCLRGEHTRVSPPRFPCSKPQITHVIRSAESWQTAGTHSAPLLNLKLQHLLAIIGPQLVHQWEHCARNTNGLPSVVAPGFSHEGIVPDDATGWWLFSGISRLPHNYIPALLHPHLISPSLALKTSPENPMRTKSGDTVRHCSSESIVYIQNSITPLDCQRIKEYVTLSEDSEAPRDVVLEGDDGLTHNLTETNTHALSGIRTPDLRRTNDRAMGKPVITDVVKFTTRTRSSSGMERGMEVFTVYVERGGVVRGAQQVARDAGVEPSVLHLGG